MIKTEHLTKRYDSLTAVDDVTFTVSPGEVLGFLGPNGAGKTTTMRMLAGFITPTSGKASICGHDVETDPLQAKASLGYLPEGAPSYGEMTVRRFLEFIADVRHLEGAQRKARLDYVIERLQLDKVLEQSIETLSKGFRRRVGLAQAIIHNPEVLILDEPTSGLDPKQINETRELIKNLAGEHTIILSTHILPEVEAICQKIVIINKGRIVATDSVENLTHRMRGSDAISLELETDGIAGQSDVQQRLESLSGVSKVLFKHATDHKLTFEVESLPGQSARADVARSVVNAGWNLFEMKSLSYSLEEVFLQLTGGSPDGDQQ